MKRMGRRHRPFYRICAVDKRNARDGRVIEELGHYDPMVSETDARTVLKQERIDYWLSVGAQPSDKIKVLIQKYGTNGTHLEAQQAAMERLKMNKPVAPPPVKVPEPEPETPPASEAPAEAAEGGDAPAAAEGDAPAADAPAAEAEKAEGGGEQA